MRFVVLIAIFGLWGCSKEAPSCPNSVRNAYQAVLEGKKPANPLDVVVGKKKEEAQACFSLFSNDPRAWNYIYGVEGKSKMAEFQKSDSEKQEVFSEILYTNFVLSSTFDFKATVPK